MPSSALNDLGVDGGLNKNDLAVYTWQASTVLKWAECSYQVWESLVDVAEKPKGLASVTKG